jgi:hypothetical protein
MSICAWANAPRAVFIDKAQAYDEQNNFCNIGREEMQDESLNVQEKAASITNSGTNRIKVVVRQHQISSVFGDVAPRQAHGHSYRGELQCRCVIHAVTRHGQMFASTLPGLNHFYCRRNGINELAHTIRDGSPTFGIRLTASNDERKLRKSINLVIGQFVEVGSLIASEVSGARVANLQTYSDNSGWGIIRCENPNLLCNGFGCGRVVSGEPGGKHNA